MGSSRAQAIIKSSMVKSSSIIGIAGATPGGEAATPSRGAYGAQESEAAVIMRCRAGDREAFEIILNRYRERVVNLAYQLLRQRESAEDVAQEAFTQAFTAIGSFRGEAQMFTWLYRITVNLCLQRRRRERSWPPLSGHDAADGSNAEPYRPELASNASPIADQTITKLMVEQTLDCLAEPLRIVLILREMHDLSYEEVAAVLNIPVGTVRSRLNEARRKFREAWYQAEQAE